MSLAKAFVTGVVTKAPEKRFTQNDLAISSFTVNIDKNSEALIRVMAFGNLAESVVATVKQGDSVAIEGRLQTNTFKTPDGRDKKVFEINASAVEKMGSQAVASVTNSQNQQNSGNIVGFSEPQEVQDLIDEDELPF